MKTGWKESIRSACSRATRENQGPRIARDTGVSLPRIHNFTSKGYLGTDDVKRIESWLHQNDYLDEQPVTDGSVSLDWAVVLAGQFEDMAQILRSADASKELKAREFVARVRGWHAGIEEMERLLKK